MVSINTPEIPVQPIENPDGIVGSSELNRGAARQAHSHQARLLRLVLGHHCVMAPE